MQVKRAELIGLLVVLSIGLVLRLYWVWAFPMEPISDYASLLNVTRFVAGGQWPGLSFAWHHHGYGLPLVLLPIVFLTDQLAAIRVATTGMQLAMIVAVWYLARALFTPRAGLAAAGMAACLPGFWMLTPLIAKENLSTLLLPLGLALSLKPGRAGRPLAAGLAFALLGVTRANFLPFLPLAGVLCMLGAARRHWLRTLAWFGAGAGLFLIPVISLNVLNGGMPLPTAAGSQQLWVVHNERANGRYVAPDNFDDSPFLGFEHWSIRLLPMRKLALQFVAANPANALVNLWFRHELHWQTDAAGFSWTYFRAPPAWQALVPLSSEALRLVVDGLFFVLLFLALVGAVRGGSRPGVTTHLALPLFYGLVTLAAAEANTRYHVTFTPLLCVLAGAAFMPPARPIWPVRQTWLVRLGLMAGLVVVLVFALSRVTSTPLSVDAILRGRWNGWLVTALAAALLAQPVACWGPGLVRWLGAAAARQPTRALALIGALAGLLLLGGVLMAREATAMVEALGAVAPQGWERYQLGEAGEQTGLPLTLVSAGMPGRLRQVSYPDGVRLTFDGAPAAGDRVGLRRQLADLTVGDEYLFYLHVYDPGSEGRGGELVIRINNDTLWQRQSDLAEPPAWHYVVAPWQADERTARISVEHIAGTPGGAAGEQVPIIRTLHLYPQY